jgi:hypothetical protein
MTPSTQELRDTFRRSGLWRMGWTFQRAIATPAIGTAIRCAASAARKRAEREGHPMPVQEALI